MGSIDVETKKGISLILIISALMGGASSTITQKMWGPGGGWEQMVAQNAVLAEQMGHTNESIDRLSTQLGSSLRSIGDKLDSQVRVTQENTQSISNMAIKIDMLDGRMDKAETKLSEIQTSLRQFP